ncbi:ABC-type multidrug transport system, ATPase and permease component [Metschnikowia aff. pulcherrima]|uniref:ABC-type multidrug transport system, ATPase and permease component n=1 Tax=Metschnikowia aff. pulcherrima TaxID=2163413 RepID=A0A4P6XK09_9ASCO|nr:ABC-type multidrug transport system, ATPase and permease component [Metschnikowia aff. pulcherrima]
MFRDAPSEELSTKNGTNKRHSFSSGTTNTCVDFSSREVLDSTDKERDRPLIRSVQDERFTLDHELGLPGLKRQDRWFSSIFGKHLPGIPVEEDRMPYPWKLVNMLSRLVFFWLWPVLIRGYKRTLVPNDLWYLPKDMCVEDMHESYRRHLNDILRKHRLKHHVKDRKRNQSSTEEPREWPMYAIPYALFLTFRLSYSLSCVFLACLFACQACAPLITKKLIVYVEYSSYGIKSYKESIGYTIGASILIFINGLLLNHFFHNAMVAGAASKLILTKDILLKSFRLLANSRHKFNTARITAMMTTDLLRIELAIGFQPLVLCFPIPVTIAVALLLLNAGVVSLAGIGLFVVSLIVCVLLTSKLYLIREIVVKHTDRRISLIREALNNLKIIKYYAWESAYKQNITNVRKKEMRYLFLVKALRNFITAYAVTLPTLTSMVSFVTMWATHSMRSPSDIFSSLSLFSILAQAVMLLPIALATGADAAIGFRRCTDFFESQELEEPKNFMEEDKDATPVTIGNAHTEEIRKREVMEIPSIAIEVRGADFVWDSFGGLPGEDVSSLNGTDRNTNYYSEQPTNLSPSVDNLGNTNYKDEGAVVYHTSIFTGLKNVNLTVETGEFVVVTGMIGSGKTSLLNALAGFLKLTNPATAYVNIDSELLLCGAPWIQNTTLRDNILFGQQFDKSLYVDVIRACCLEEDIAQLSHGDLTEIGEKGVTLSGGQKARISLARAAYTKSRTILFDDVLSAVDSRVGKHITSRLFYGLMRGHTRILATHQISLVLGADKIIFLNGDGTIDVGSTEELLQRNEGFRRLYEFSDTTTTRCEQNRSTQDDLKADNVCLLSDFEAQQSPKTPQVKNFENDFAKTLGSDFGKIVKEEDVSVNPVTWNVYKEYIKMGQGKLGYFATPLFLIFVALSTFCQLFTNTWLSFWIENRFSRMSDLLYVTIYVVLAILTVCFTATQFTILAYINNKSARTLNVKATERVLHVPMSFMDTNPLGRVLNRFTKDTDSLDNALGEQLTLFVFPLATIIGIIILCICYLPWFAIAVPFFATVFLFFSSLYSASSREIKRIEAVQRSVVYNNFNEVLHGMATIKAYRAESAFIQKNDILLNRMNEASFLSIATQRWLCVHLDTIAALFALLICLLCVTNAFHISASSTGLLLNYVIQIVGLLSLTVRAMTQVETEMNSVERLHSYAFNLPQEAVNRGNVIRMPMSWPKVGYVQFTNVSLRYRPALPLVLKQLTFGVYPGEKLGICGRTGAGKSSIMTGIYRINELDSGTITIDGVDVSQLALCDLRAKLLIIPQDPVLFEGTIRSNLDPFQNCDDDTLWESLRRSGLVKGEDLLVARSTKWTPGAEASLHKFHLDRIVEDDGSNFSLGEKQLLALARSLIRNTRILILDEATLSVDYETDAKIQQTIATEFSKCTVLCIAHRLRTILSYDRIIVMDDGHIVEKGVPFVLFQQNGLFRNMCDKAQITIDDFCKRG